jgi:hypothetical protein
VNRIYFDTEFIEDGKTIELLSIGMVKDNGDTYYAEIEETDRTLASEWVAKNVFPHLTGPVKPKAVVAQEIVEFVGTEPEFWAYFADYDWVALCQLYGTMMDLPPGWPMFCRDLKQKLVEGNYSGVRLPPIDEEGPEHNALVDAKWVAAVHKLIHLLDRMHDGG